jgi:methyl-accepting chemotaxis protein
MSPNLRSMVSNVSESVSRVANTSKMLSQVAVQTGEATEQVVRTVGEMADGANKYSAVIG